jgi:hypothetical protein
MIRFQECIIFRPINTRQLNICNKLNIPFLTSAIYGANFPVYIGDFKDKDNYLKIIEEEEEKQRLEDEEFNSNARK